MGLHARAAVARLHLPQLGFLVLCLQLLCSDVNDIWQTVVPIIQAIAADAGFTHGPPGYVLCIPLSDSLPSLAYANVHNLVTFIICRLQLGDVNWMIDARLTKATLYRKEFGQQHKVNMITYFIKRHGK